MLYGELAQLAAHRVCNAGVQGSSPWFSTNLTGRGIGVIGNAALGEIRVRFPYSMRPVRKALLTSDAAVHRLITDEAGRWLV